MAKKATKEFSRKHIVVRVKFYSGIKEDKTMPLSFLKRLLKDGYEKLSEIQEVINLNTNTDIKSKLEHEPKKRHEHNYKEVWNNGTIQVLECSICKRVAQRKIK